jgi:hypothetical protein
MSKKQLQPEFVNKAIATALRGMREYALLQQCRADDGHLVLRCLLDGVEEIRCALVGGNVALAARKTEELKARGEQRLADAAQLLRRCIDQASEAGRIASDAGVADEPDDGPCPWRLLTSSMRVLGRLLARTPGRRDVDDTSSVAGAA